MYPSSSSSSSQRSMAASSGLIRYGSAPGSLITRAVDSVIGTNPEVLMGHHHHHHPHQHYFSGDSSSLTTESTCKVNNNNLDNPSSDTKEVKGLQRSFGLNELTVGDFTTASNLKLGGGGGGGGGVGGGTSSSSPPPPPTTSSLVRHSSSPAGFLNYSASENAGFSVTRGAGSYNTRGGFNGGHGISRLKPQLSFTRQDSSLSQISEVSENIDDGINSNNGVGHRDAAVHSYATANYGMDSWDNHTIAFSNPTNKRAKNMSGDFLNCPDSLESQFSMPQTSLEMATIEKLLQIPEDSVPCKIRAKRGFATHPRSIAERERRTRISGKLKKLQDLVPNMDKQTSYADMLDLAVQHIKGLQNQVQNLNKDLESCTCGCKDSHDVCQQ